MNFQEYVPLALKTKAPTDSKELDFLHSAYGLVTETGELVDIFKKHIFYNKDLDLVNLKEEIGDLFWYCALAIDSQFESEEARDWTLKEFDDSMESLSKIELTDNQTYLQWLTTFSSSIFIFATEEEKITEAYDVLYEVGKLFFVLGRMLLLNTPEYSVYQCIEDNITKLAKRYPEKFTQEAALNRDTVNELSHISDGQLPLEGV